MLTRIDAEQWAVNPAVHYNRGANFQKSEFHEVVTAFADFLATMQCQGVEGLPATIATWSAQACFAGRKRIEVANVALDVPAVGVVRTSACYACSVPSLKASGRRKEQNWTVGQKLIVDNVMPWINTSNGRWAGRATCAERGAIMS